jgi:hypothetical protein
LSTIIISDQLPEKTVEGYCICQWRDSRPSVEGCDVVVLDLYLGKPTNEGYYPTSKPGAHFYELGDQVARNLRAGGIVIALLGPLAVGGRNLSATYTGPIIGLKQKHQYQAKFITQLETSYDWLDQGFLEVTKIDSRFARNSTGIVSVSRRASVKSYIDLVNEYWVSIEGIQIESGFEGTIPYHVADYSRWSCYTQLRSRVIVLAKGRHTKLPVAAAIQYMNWDGVLVFLPPFDPLKLGNPLSDSNIMNLCQTLRDLAIDIRQDFGKGKAAQHEEWVWSHRSAKSMDILSQIEQIKEKESKLLLELDPLEQMLWFLDGVGDLLVDAVAAFFNRPNEGIKVERTQKGAALDLFVYDGKGRTLAIEVTGIRGKLSKDDPHWSDFLGYLPEHNARNESSRIERIVLVVNTEAKTKLDDRDSKHDITVHVRKTVSDNEICVVRSCDLYRLWLQTLDGLPVQQVFDMLFSCDGIFELPAP